MQLEELCGSITAILHGSANRTSAELARAVGPFAMYSRNRDAFLQVMQMHQQAVEEIDDAGPQYLKDAARTVLGRSGQKVARPTVSGMPRPPSWLRPAQSVS